MSRGTDLLQEWLDLRATTKLEGDLWEEQRRGHALAEILKGDGIVKLENGMNKLGTIASAPGHGTYVEIPYDLLTAKQRREVERFKSGDLIYPMVERQSDLTPAGPDLSQKAPSLLFADSLCQGQLLNPRPEDIKAFGDAATRTASVLDNCTLYAWGTDPICAVLEASKSLPPESSIIPDLYTELPRRGLWIFDTPIQNSTTTHDHEVSGILWELSHDGLWLTTLIRVRKEIAGVVPWKHVQAGKLTGTFVGFFPAHTSLESLAAFTRKRYAERLEQDYQTGLSGNQHAETSLLFTRFWLSAVQWMRQRVLVRSRPPSVMPKNKKRARKFARRSKGRIPIIEIVQLRRTEGGQTDGAGTSRSYSVRFIVHGHWRNQWYSRAGVHAPKWIEAYVKGPHDAPLKEALRVYDVSR